MISWGCCCVIKSLLRSAEKTSSSGEQDERPERAGVKRWPVTPKPWPTCDFPPAAAPSLRPGQLNPDPDSKSSAILVKPLPT